MKKGLLIANSFLATDKFTEHYRWLCDAAKKRKIALELVGNAEILVQYETGDISRAMSWIAEYSFVIFWDKDLPLGRYLTFLCREQDVPIYNRLEAIASCDDKSATYQVLTEWNYMHQSGERIPLLPTVIAPMTYGNVGYGKTDFLDTVEQVLSFPVVVKECFGSFGMQVYLAKSREELSELVSELAGKPMLFQKFLEQSAGCDVRLQVVGDRVVAGMYRYSENGDFRANITNGGRMRQYHPSQEEEALAVRTARALGLDFAGVDLLFSKGKNGGADIVCEVNSNAHFKNIYTCTGVNVAEQIIEYICG